MRLRKKSAIRTVTLAVICSTLPLFSQVASTAEPPATKRVLALYWYGRDFPGNEVFDRTLRTTFLKFPQTIEYYAEYLESNRFPGENQSLALRDYLRRKYADHKLDVVIAMSEVSLDFLLQYRSQLFPATPLIFYSTNGSDLRRKAAEHALTGVLVAADRYKRTLGLALKFHPDTKQVYVIYGMGAAAGTTTGERIMERIRGELKEFEGRVSLNYIADISLNELLAKVRTFSERSLILYVRQSQDDPGHILAPVECLALIAQATSVPIYGPVSSYLGHGIVGGYVTYTETGASKTAEIAMRVAGGTRPQDIALAEMPVVPAFDWRQLRRWRISDSTLPADSIILFREPTVWDQYRWHIMAAFLVCLIQALLIGVLLVERNLRRKGAEALERANGMLRKSMAEVNNLSGRLLSAQEDERRRISRELHDDFSQQIAALGIRLSGIKRNLLNQESARADVSDVQAGLERLADSLHTLSHHLHPTVLERAGLAQALKSHCDEFSALTGIEIHLIADIRGPVPSEVALSLFRIAQESLRNVERHSGSKQAWVSLTESNNQIFLTIEDSGCGFDPHTVGGGIGLVSMKERVRLIGGTFHLESRAGKGTSMRVQVHVPGPTHTLAALA